MAAGTVWPTRLLMGLAGEQARGWFRYRAATADELVEGKVGVADDDHLASPRHVPAKIIAVPGIPYTLNMKKVEMAVKKVIDGEPVLNKDALGNPEVLDFYAGVKELQED